MNTKTLFALVVAFCALQWVVVRAELEDHRIAYGSVVNRHSFQNYDLVRGQEVPGWTSGAGARVEDTELGQRVMRLTPARQSRMGYMWNTLPSTLTDWEATLRFRVSGRPNIGGDGFALWYTAENSQIGSVFGNQDYWDGIAIMFDTFNNDGVGDHPQIALIANDGSLEYAHGSDGTAQSQGHCAANFRNLDQPTTVRITYEAKTLRVEIDLLSDGQWRDCFTANDIDLGVDKYFGLSAATGDVADNHDIESFSVRTLMPPNVDLDRVRREWAQKHARSNMARGGMPISDDEFQNEALRLLHQVHSSVNVVENGQTSLAATTREIQEALSTISPSSMRRPIDTSRGSDAATGQISEISRQQSDILSRLNDLTTSRRTPSLQLILDRLGRIEADAEASRSERRPVSGSNAGAQQCDVMLNRMDRLSTSASNAERIIKNVESLIRQGGLAAGSAAVAAAASSGGSSWVTILIAFVMGVASGAGIMWYAGRSSRNPYKLP